MAQNIRHILVLVLGVLLIWDSVMREHFRPLEFVTGIIMLGLIPFDRVFDYYEKKQAANDEAELARLREMMKGHESQ